VVGGVRTRRGREKPLLGMVAELTAFALTHAVRLKASEESSQLDGLTGALGRKHFLARLEDEIRAADDAGTVFSVVLVDLDEFEGYNSMHGHHEGDEVLKRVAQVLRAGVRGEDVVARYGGEEFGVLLAGASKDVGMRVAETLREAVARTPFAHGELQPGGRLTVSAGVATFPEDSKRGEQLLFCAEEALLHAKARGRNQVVAASPSFLS
jgi:diguanylate cyclase (GGDEF)-like protein